MTDRIDISREAEAGQAGLRVDQAAAELFPEFSRARLQSWIRDGSLTLDGRPVKPKHRLAGGETLRLDAKPEPDEETEPQDVPLAILHRDESIIVLDKPAGLVVHPAAGHPGGTLQNGLLYRFPELAVVPRAGIVHRLDKDTSGVMVVARTLQAHARLVAQLQRRSMSRVYEAVVHGVTAGRGTVNAPVGRNPRDRQRMAVVASGRPAVSHYERLEAFRHFSHLQVSLETGRTHQIRVHMKHLGHPLVGDPQYGRKTPAAKDIAEPVLAAVRGFPRQALHARRISLSHPVTGERNEFESPLPADIVGLLQVLGQDDR